MSRQFDDDDEELEEPPPGPGHVRSTGPGPLVVFALVGLVVGWLVRRVSTWLDRSPPTVGWMPVLALLLAALVVWSVAWLTHRALHRRHERIAPHQAVNRLVLAKASALAGAMVAGGYFGYALSWWGSTDSDLAQQRLVQSLAAGVAAVLLVAGSLLLERACRVDDHQDRDLG